MSRATGPAGLGYTHGTVMADYRRAQQARRKQEGGDARVSKQKGKPAPMPPPGGGKTKPKY